MKAVVVHEYGAPEVLNFEQYPDPVAGTGEVLVRIAATSINPFDIMRRSGIAKEVAPIKFPGIVGVDLSGNVGRSAVFTAKALGAVVIAGVLKTQLKAASNLGADQVVPTDDDGAMASLPPLDAVADAVGGETAEKLLAKVKKSGVFASVLGAPQNAKDFPNIKIVAVYTQVDKKILLYMAQDVRDGKLVIPIGRRMPLKNAAQGHAAVAKGGAGKILLVVDEH